jgi:hypothetical protein
VRISSRLIAAVKLHRERQYRLTMRARLHPTTLSRLLNGAEKPRPDDKRVIALAKVVGVPVSDCFE